MKQKELYELAVRRRGPQNQIVIAIDKMAILISALISSLRNQTTIPQTIAEEVADVEIMLAQLRVIYPGIEKEVQRWKRIKKRRLLKRIRQ